MKSINEIEKKRKFYHKFVNRNTSHRSSLTVPNFSFCETSFSFLNHFLIKRGYKEVSCKMSSISKNGELIDSYTYKINQPKVYEFNLSKMFNSRKYNINHFIVEFFSSHNLYIPFPAVMVNHFNNKFFNMVHSYNRVLNDVFENDQNYISTFESSFECYNNKKFDTFFNFCTGPTNFQNKIDLQLINSNKKKLKKIDISQPRLTNRNFFLSEIFKNTKKNNHSFLKILQPKQEMFFNRLLAGTCTKKFDAFSANHTYYDTSNHLEYFKNNESNKTYPYFYGFKNKLAFYPILAPGKLKISVEILSNNLLEKKFFIFDTTKNKPLIIDINNEFKDEILKETTAFNLIVKSVTGGIPKRVNHQLIYGSKNNEIPLNASINVSLNNKEIFQPSKKKGFRWGQVICGAEYVSRVGICSTAITKDKNENENVLITFYDEYGKIKSIKKKIKKLESHIIDLNNYLKIKKNKKIIWFTIQSKKPNILAFSFHINKKSEFSSGEHAF